MKKFMAILIILMTFNTVFAHGEEVISQAENIIGAKIPCDDLTDDQLEIIGDYYMEQMHPGELHEVMDERMGGEGSESLRQTHINMARSFYCGEHEEIGYGMMGAMMGRDEMMYSSGMIGGNYMGYYNDSSVWNSWLFWPLYIAVLAFVFGLVFWGTKKLFNKR